MKGLGQQELGKALITLDFSIPVGLGLEDVKCLFRASLMVGYGLAGHYPAPCASRLGRLQGRPGRRPKTQRSKPDL